MCQNDSIDFDNIVIQINDEYIKKRKPKSKKKKVGVMDIALIFIAVTLVVFTIAMLCLFDKHESIPDTLCQCVFAALIGECSAMAWIKTAKEKYRKHNDDIDSETTDYIDEEC